MCGAVYVTTRACLALACVKRGGTSKGKEGHATERLRVPPRQPREGRLLTLCTALNSLDCALTAHTAPCTGGQSEGLSEGSTNIPSHETLDSHRLRFASLCTPLCTILILHPHPHSLLYSDLILSLLPRHGCLTRLYHQNIALTRADSHPHDDPAHRASQHSTPRLPPLAIPTDRAHHTSSPVLVVVV